MFIVVLTIAGTWKQPSNRKMNGLKSFGTYIQWNITQSLKRNIFESVLMRWMNLEPIKQREKQTSYINAYIYGMQKDSTKEPICRAPVEMHTQGTALWTQWGRKGWTNWENSIETCTSSNVEQITEEMCCMTQGAQTWCSVTAQLSATGREMGGRLRREGTCVTYGWFTLTHSRNQHNTVTQSFSN